MNINYLSVLPKVQQLQEKNYTILEDKGDGFKSAIIDTVKFDNADRNGDDFLNYDELAEIKLALLFDAKKDKFELAKGINFISQDAIDEILANDGLSLNSLQNELKNLDKNNDKKIKSDEIKSLNTSELIRNNQRDLRIYKLQEIKESSNQEITKTSENKKIAALDKQIKNLQKMLESLTSQKMQEPVTQNVSTKEAQNHSSKSIEHSVNVDELKSKYGEEDVNSLIQVIKSTPKVATNIDGIISKTDTKVPVEDILDLSAGMDMLVDTEIAVSEMMDMAGVEQLSPANTPLNLDKKKIDFSINQIKAKIADLEGMKSKILDSRIEEEGKKLSMLA